MARLMVGVAKETAPGERRVALVPAAVGAVSALGVDVAVQAGAGAAAGFTDAAYAEAGVAVLTRSRLFGLADLLVGVQAPRLRVDCRLRRGQALMGLLQPLRSPLTIRNWAVQGITSISLDLMPSALIHGELLDAAASQERITGYEAVLVAAHHCGRCLPATVGEEGTGPVRVLVVGGGATGLQAMATAHGLGARVEVYDASRRAIDEVLCAGAEYLDLSAAGFPAAVRLALTAVIPRFDIVIATPWEPPGAEPDGLITAEAVRAMRPGSVVVDTTVEPGIGTVELAVPDTTVTAGPGILVIGAGNLPSRVAATASAAFAHRIAALLAHLIHDGALAIELTDPLQAAIVVTHRGNVLNDAVWQQILDVTAPAGLP
ncbi:NAD(P) transhydrogenase subunit alpha [Actinomadura alba]|uniref:proton-translocating NAD(P)(+) transhydrogenase n=1 Tax=Actinomadura alba TaxID=406431 RepID=A0ABR7LTD5_9ACTN|nr:NAD(P) transhydrogenase subunit alpha [Actinomadura alba]MBC6468113.1 NAD(P) transhydrogenase subunit alpha [Actinomadura alba]